MRSGAFDLTTPFTDGIGSYFHTPGFGARAKPTHARALRRRWRSLARLRARCVAVAVEAEGGYVARHARCARRPSRACTRTSSPRIARVITVFRPPRARPARARCCGGARSLARSRARRRRRWGWQCRKRLRCSRCCGARAWHGTRMPPRMCHRTRQESTTPRPRFSCDLAVARPPVKVAFANNTNTNKN